MFIDLSWEERNALLQYMGDWFMFTCPDPENDYDYTHVDSLYEKRFICTRGSYEDCPEEAYVYRNYGDYYLIRYIYGERDEKKWL